MSRSGLGRYAADLESPNKSPSEGVTGYNCPKNMPKQTSFVRCPVCAMVTQKKQLKLTADTQLQNGCETNVRHKKSTKHGHESKSIHLTTSRNTTDDMDFFVSVLSTCHLGLQASFPGSPGSFPSESMCPGTEPSSMASGSQFSTRG